MSIFADKEVYKMRILRKMETEVVKSKHNVYCPKCGNILFDARGTTGEALIRARCRKCKSFVSVLLQPE